MIVKTIYKLLFVYLKDVFILNNSYSISAKFSRVGLDLWHIALDESLTSKLRYHFIP